MIPPDGQEVASKIDGSHQSSGAQTIKERQEEDGKPAPSSAGCPEMSVSDFSLMFDW